MISSGNFRRLMEVGVILKFLLVAINAKYIHSNLAVYSLKASAGADGGCVRIAEYTINNYVDEILSSIYKQRPDVVAFSCYIWNIGMVEELADLLYKAAPGIPIWAGGPEVSYDAPEFLERNPAFTGVMCGEGEATFAELVHGYACGVTDAVLSQIDGLVFRGMDGAIHATAPRAPMNMDDLPFSYGDLELFKNKIIYYESSRGCPFSCSYCLSSIDKHVRFRSLEKVKRELKVFMDAGIPQVKFVDRTFNCSHSRTLELWRFIRDHDNGITNFHFEITADLLDDAELELLSTLRPGLVQLEIGVQSTNPKTIGEIDRIMDFEQLSGIVRRIAEGHNVHQHLDLIAGLPYEGMDSFINSFNDVYALAPQQLQMGFLKVLKGSKMHRVRDDYGLVYRTKPAYEVMGTRWLDFDDILVLKGVEEMVEVYYNSCQFRLSLMYLLHFFNTPYELFAELADYYERRGYNNGKHSRLERYEILRGFAAEGLAGNSGWEDRESFDFDMSAMEAVLTYDLYSREKIKTRPAWAYDNGPFKSEIAAFYSSPEMREKYFAGADGESCRQIRNRTHVEIFRLDVTEAARTGRTVLEPMAILFDYSLRDPLTYEGKATELKGDLDAKEKVIAEEAADCCHSGEAG